MCVCVCISITESGISFRGPLYIPESYCLHDISLHNQVECIHVSPLASFIGSIAARISYFGTVKIYIKTNSSISNSDLQTITPVIVNFKENLLIYEDIKYESSANQSSDILTLPNGIKLRYEPDRSLFYSGHNVYSSSLAVYLLIFATDRQGVKTSSYETNCKYYDETKNNWTTNDKCKVS